MVFDTRQPSDRQFAQQIRVYPVLGVRTAGPGTLIYRRKPHPGHEAPHAVTTDFMAKPAPVAHHLPVAGPRTIEEHRVDHLHQRQCRLALRHGLIVPTRPASATINRLG